MSLVIHRFSIPTHKEFVELLPENSFVLTVQAKENDPSFWVRYDPNDAMVEKMFRVYATGEPSIMKPDETEYYLGSYQVQEGSATFVHHMFEVVKT